MRVALLSYTAGRNAVGRVYSNWIAASAVGLEVRTLVPSIEEVWPPISGEADFIGSMTDDTAAIAAWADVLVAHKPWPGSYDVARKVRRDGGTPVVVDIDDPDFEALYGQGPRERVLVAAKMLRHGRLRRLREYPYVAMLRRAVGREPFVTLSNPALSRWYPSGTILPHARRVLSEPLPPTESSVLNVAFVGTLREHKGVDVLRAATARAGRMHLTITGEQPVDARPHETWTGVTSAIRGREIVSSSDVVAVISEDSITSRGQLPAKLIDAMMAGRAVIGSDLPPIRWALGSAGLLIPPGDVDATVRALGSMRDPLLRRRLGESARARAVQLFSDRAVGATLESVCAAAMAGRSEAP